VAEIGRPLLRESSSKADITRRSEHVRSCTDAVPTAGRGQLTGKSKRRTLQQMARIAQKLDEVVCEVAAIMWLLKVAQQ
jgi:hypothetical protein